eukprot:COSAG01_NODE_104_length_26171_cov_96.617612_18_plen_42_part_00
MVQGSRVTRSVITRVDTKDIQCMYLLTSLPGLYSTKANTDL